MTQPLSALDEGGLSPSGTLPVLHINTANGVPVDSKENYVDATYYLDALGIDGFNDLGSKSAPLKLQIRGRGNATWELWEKKSYKIKLSGKSPMLGLSKSKHFALMAHADDWLCYLCDAVGFEAGRLLGMAWNPRQVAVEVVLNDDYIGLYFLSETVRVEKERVNITEQEDGDTIPTNITGGWLVEIDNYYEENQVRIPEDETWLRGIYFTPHSPEALSNAQHDYLTQLVTDATNEVNDKDIMNPSWTNYIDIDALARFYIVTELMDDKEGFHGSCYWHKQRGDDTKIVFGPLWDMGYSLQRGFEPEVKYYFQDNDANMTWVRKLLKKPAFCDCVVKHWEEFVRLDNISRLEEYAMRYASTYERAFPADHARWPKYASNNFESRRDTFIRFLRARYEFLKANWKPGWIVTPGDVNLDMTVNTSDVTALINRILASDNFSMENDVNDDGIVDVSDVTELVNNILNQ